MPNNPDADGIKTVMRDSLIQQALALLKFTNTEAQALQVPDTDILILVGPQQRIQGYLNTPIPYGAAGTGLRDSTLEEAANALDLLNDSAGDAAAYDNREMDMFETERMQTLALAAEKIRALKSTSPAPECDPAASQVDPRSALPSRPGSEYVYPASVFVDPAAAEQPSIAGAAKGGDTKPDESFCAATTQASTAQAEALLVLQQVKQWDIDGWKQRGFALPTELRAKIQALVGGTQAATSSTDSSLTAAEVRDAAPAGWQPVMGAGQVKVGDKLRFKIGDKEYSERAKRILHAGTDKEEVIYDKGRNFYFITAMVLSGFSNHMQVEFLRSAGDTGGVR